MKKIVFFIIALVFAVCSVSCSAEPEESVPPLQTQEPEKIVLIGSNADKYLAIEITFSELSFAPSQISLSEQYYITCNATIFVKPRADYKFTNASVKVSLSNNDWQIASENGGFYKTWSKSIDLDKNGYGKATAFMFSRSFLYENSHPATKSWQPKFISATGTIIVN